VQQLCAAFENETDIDVLCVRCGVRRHSFWTDLVGELITYLRETIPWADRIVCIAHNAKAFDLHFVLNRIIQLKWTPDLIMNGMKIMCVKVEGMTWLGSLNYIGMPLRKLPEAFGLASVKSWYPYLFNTAENMNYLGPMPDVTFYGLDQMSHSERKDFLSWSRPSDTSCAITDAYCSNTARLTSQC
jgi:hypothetical protein